MLSKDEVKHIASLANLPLNAEEVEKFRKQIPEILEHVNRLQELDLDGVEETPQVTNKTNELREDKVLESLSQEEALGQSSRTKSGYFVVKAIFDNE